MVHSGGVAFPTSNYDVLAVQDLGVGASQDVCNTFERATGFPKVVDEGLCTNPQESVESVITAGEFGPSIKFSDEIVAPGAKVRTAGLGVYVRALASPPPNPNPNPSFSFSPLQDWQSFLHWIPNPVTYTHLHLISPSVLSLAISRATN
jgi:hypothetical protein